MTNVERSGVRDLTLSTACRGDGSSGPTGLRGLRHLDLDMYQYCPKPDCPSPFLIVMEASTSQSKSYRLSRQIADRLGCEYAWLITHVSQDIKLEHPVTVTDMRSDKVILANGTWDQFRSKLSYVHANHMRSEHGS